MTFHIEYPRTIPARKPVGHTPAAPRYGLRWSKPVPVVISDYFALQGKDLGWDDQHRFFERARQGLAVEDGPESFEIMRCVDERGYTNAIVVAYWTDALAHARWNEVSAFRRWFSDDERLTETTGVWRETLSVPYDRHETLYSESSYRVGLGKTRDSEMVTLDFNGYFGAARDRLPISAIDHLDSPFARQYPPERHLMTEGQRLRVAVPLNITTLRSGQFWEHAETEQLSDYIDNMRPRLMTGMNFLTANRKETGTLRLLIMTNLNDDGTERKETSVYAHFLSLSHLEEWSASHKTHLDIYRHAIAMNRKYKEKRQFVSWHEVFVLMPSAFEYANCHPETGLLPYFDAVRVSSAEESGTRAIQGSGSTDLPVRSEAE